MSFILAISIAFGRICVKADPTPKIEQNQHGSISKKQKIVGEISTVKLTVANLIVGDVYYFQQHYLPVLIMGGDENVKKHLLID